MPTQRNGYGLLAYSDGDFGTSGSIIDGAASASVSSSATAGGYTTTLFSASGSASSTVTASANATFASGALVSSTATNASIAEQFVLKESSGFSYGHAPYGSYDYGESDLQTIAGATATATASASKVQTGSASSTVSASTSCDSTRVREGDANPSASASTIAHSVFIVSVAVDITPSASIAVNYIRTRNATALKSVTSVVSAVAREKWEPIPTATTTWTKVA